MYTFKQKNTSTEKDRELNTRVNRVMQTSIKADAEHGVSMKEAKTL